MRVIVVGMSEVGVALANILSSEGHSVSVIENDSEKLKSSSRLTDAQIFEGDGADIDILKDARIDEADAIIACTNDDRTNLMSCMVANTMEVPKILSLVNHPKNEGLFIKHGVTIVSEVSNIASSLELLLYQRSRESILATIANGMIIRVEVGEESPLIDKQPKLKKGKVCMALRNDELVNPEKIDKVKNGDSFIIFCFWDQLEDVLKEVIGE